MHAELPDVTVIRGPSPGPTVAVLGGVHGDEYEGVIAATAIGRMLQTTLVRGTVRIAAPAHPAAWTARTRQSPIDGANLARVFPGRADGSATERVAHAITEHVIRGSDLLVDLHSAGSGFEMPFLCGYHGDGDNGIESQRYADAFAARFTWRHDGVPEPGRSLTAAFELGIPAIYVEGHGGLSIRAGELQGYIDGVRRVLHLLGMLADAPPPSHRTGPRARSRQHRCGDRGPVGGLPGGVQPRRRRCPARRRHRTDRRCGRNPPRGRRRSERWSRHAAPS